MKKAKKRFCLHQISFRQRTRFTLFTHNVFSLPISYVHNVSDYDPYRKLKVKAKTYYGNSQYRKKEKVFNIGLYNSHLSLPQNEK